MNTSLLSLVLIYVILLTSTVNAIQRCDNGDASTNALRVIKSQEDMRKAKIKGKPVKKAVAPQLYELRVVFHVLMSDDGSQGFVPLDSIQANIDSANKVYSGAANTRGAGFEANLRLFLAGVTYTNNSNWFFNCQDYTTAGQFKYATALSAATTINIWTCYSANLLGWVHYLPYELSQWSVWNGVNINYQSLPLSKTDPSYTNYGDYADGDTLTHETGHYLGLLHTFGDGVDGCSNGDDIADTPPEKTPSSGKMCLMKPPRKTCPNSPGVDPVWNIMDYSDDTCAEEFTHDQVDVMRYSIEQYKPNLIAYEPLRCVADGTRGTARKMTVCKSECFTDRNAPDGRPAPSNGWCRTDAVGNWGQCCCTADCFVGKINVPSPATLSCAKKQDREELFKSMTSQCVVANIGGGIKGQVTLDSCKVSEFVRWAFNYDGTITSIGSGWCLSVIGYTTGMKIDGMRVGLEPCAIGKASQRFNVLASSPKVKQGGTLSLQAAPGYCIDPSDGTFQMKACVVGQVNQKWQRVGKVDCGSFRNRAQCAAAPTSFGCSCRWIKNKCIS